ELMNHPCQPKRLGTQSPSSLRNDACTTARASRSRPIGLGCTSQFPGDSWINSPAAQLLFPAATASGMKAPNPSAILPPNFLVATPIGALRVCGAAADAWSYANE